MTSDPKHAVDYLANHNPCPTALSWLFEVASPYKAWQTCPQAEWLIWGTIVLGVDKNLILRAVCDCVGLTLKYLPKDEKRPIHGLKLAETAAKRRAREQWGAPSRSALAKACDACNRAAVELNSPSDLVAAAAAGACIFAANPTYGSAANEAVEYVLHILRVRGGEAKAQQRIARTIRRRITWKVVKRRLTVIDRRERR